MFSRKTLLGIFLIISIISVPTLASAHIDPSVLSNINATLGATNTKQLNDSLGSIANQATSHEASTEAVTEVSPISTTIPVACQEQSGCQVPVLGNVTGGTDTEDGALSEEEEEDGVSTKGEHGKKVSEVAKTAPRACPEEPSCHGKAVSEVARDKDEDEDKDKENPNKSARGNHGAEVSEIARTAPKACAEEPSCHGKAVSAVARDKSSSEADVENGSGRAENESGAQNSTHRGKGKAHGHNKK